MKWFSKIKTAALVSAAAVSEAAFATVDVNDIRGTSGAGSRTAADQVKSYMTQFQSFLDFALVAAALAGIVVFIFAILSYNKAAKEERPVPASTKVGLMVGPALIVVPILVGLLANTLVS